MKRADPVAGCRAKGTGVRDARPARKGASPVSVVICANRQDYLQGDGEDCG